VILKVSHSQGLVSLVVKLATDQMNTSKFKSLELEHLGYTFEDMCLVLADAAASVTSLQS